MIRTAQLTPKRSEPDVGCSTSDRIAQIARDLLENNAFFRGRTNMIQIDEHDGTLVLRGCVPSFYLKQVLQTTLRDIAGVTRIDNRVEVLWPKCNG